MRTPRSAWNRADEATTGNSPIIALAVQRITWLTELGMDNAIGEQNRARAQRSVGWWRRSYHLRSERAQGAPVVRSVIKSTCVARALLHMGSGERGTDLRASVTSCGKVMMPENGLLVAVHSVPRRWCRKVQHYPKMDTRKVQCSAD